MAKDPLESLLIDADAFDQQRLAEVLEGYVGIDSSDGRIVLRQNFSSLKGRQKVLCFLLARKVARLLDVREEESIAPQRISNLTGIPAGTVRRVLSELREDRLVSKLENGRYEVSAHQVHHGVKELEEDNG